MNITSRKRVLTFLERNQSATAAEIARALRITAANARHHLSQLVADGLVRETGMRQSSGRGRPTKIYSLSGDAVTGENTSQVLGAVLDFLGERFGESERAQLIDFVTERLSGPDILPRGTHITRRLSAAIDRLNTLKYHARWEAHASGPRIIFFNCPYRNLIDLHPELCRMDAALLARLVGQDAEQAAKLEPSERGLPYCLFLL